MASVITVYNMALSHLGVGKEVARTTENSAEAKACNTFYETTLKSVLRDFPWPFATEYHTLEELDDNPDEDNYAYAYQYPTDCLAARRILSGIRNDNRQTRVHFKVVRQNGSKILLTDQEDAVLEYTSFVEDVDDFDPDFMQALSRRLASYIAPRLTKSKATETATEQLKFYQFELTKARANALNEEQAEEEPQSEFIRVRDGSTEED